MTAVIGKNGVGKSSLLDAFGFLSDCIETDIESACNARNRGGFDKLISSGKESKISFTIYYRESSNDRPITYEVSIGKSTDNGLPIVFSERLRQRRKGQTRGQPLSFLRLEQGEGNVWVGNNSYEGSQNEEDKKIIKLNPHKLSIVTLAEHIEENPRIKKFKDFIQSWHLSYFTPDAARKISQAGHQKRISLHGDNIGNFVQYLESVHHDVFKKILKDISGKIPGIGKIETYRDKISNNLYLLFTDKGFTQAFTQQQMSDGTLKIFCYMLLLRAPERASFICIEEPENGLHHQMLEFLVNEFREQTTQAKASQVFITTHQPYLVDALNSDELWILEKETNGFAKITRADKYEFVQGMTEEGQPLGSLWHSKYFGGN